MYPDGAARDMLVINGQYPGPVLRANWGDFIEVDVTNSMENNGYDDVASERLSLADFLKDQHALARYHATKFLHPGWVSLVVISTEDATNPDSVNGVTECPIPPGTTRKYKFQATQFVGTMIIEGPAAADYDIDLGTMPITDYYHKSAWTEAHVAERAAPPKGDNILVNGTNINVDTGHAGRYHNNTLVKGQRYLLRLINSAVDNAYMISLDNHKLKVIQADFVPIKPYEADWVFIGIGQRLDVVFTAEQNGDLANYWFRAEVPSGCGGNLNTKSGVAIFNYQDTDLDPKSTPATYTPRCYDETNLVPRIAKPVSRTDFANTYAKHTNTLTVNLTTDSHKVFFWTINNRSIDVDWENPTLKYIAEGKDTYKSNPALNVYELPDANVWSFWVIQNIFSVAHPIHLHGHNFYLLGASPNVASPSPVAFTEKNIDDLNFTNPTRRDVAMLPGNGWMVLAFKTDNPGAWLMHCHIAWHVSAGLGVQFVERASEIDTTMSMGNLKSDCDAWTKWNNDRKKDDSGL
ncbi:hypothetical protein EG329_005045 [Mollisiaceae sp. DMI_Dod_QoI]|nr:hypothetical protein EG329_005045 [Helotiales sp. DMI_Dod_QoI]